MGFPPYIVLKKKRFILCDSSSARIRVLRQMSISIHIPTLKNIRNSGKVVPINIDKGLYILRRKSIFSFNAIRFHVGEDSVQPKTWVRESN